MTNSAVFLMGPTASGKTELVIELAQHFPVDIISVDSGMIYRTLDIGTAKPTLEEQKKAPHLLIDICDPAQAYSAAQFREEALLLIEKAFIQNRIPLLVGGTMLYFQVLKYGLSPMPKANPEIREQIEKQAKDQGWRSLHAFLQSIDPQSAAQIHPHDPQRISRALEVYWATGKTRTQLWSEKSELLSFNMVPIVLMPSQRSTLHHRIENRFYEMLKKGFLEEVEQLYQRGDLSADMPSIRAVGYRQAWQYLSDSLSKEAMIEQTICATRQLAKRQITWLKRWSDAAWFESEDSACREKIISFLKRESTLKKFTY